MNVAYNCDCMEYMRTLPDKAFDLAVVDPPYGDGLHAENGGGKGWFTKYNQKVEGQESNPVDCHNLRGRFARYDNSQSVQVEREQPAHYNRFGSPGSRFEKYKRNADGWNVGDQVRKKIIAWDVAPGAEYFEELRRVSRNQIIWGGNYFSLPPTRCFLVWRKATISENFTMAMAEYAWTSFNSNAKVYEAMPQDPMRFHPTQKPVGLYRWIYSLYAKPGDKILDTHLGSGSSRIAAYDAGLDFVGCEIDKTYFDKQEERFAEYTAQQSLFYDYEQEAFT